MKGIFKILSAGILLLALIGAMVLVRKNQETRRGAAANETNSSVLPDVITTTAGQNFTVDVWMNTGSADSKLQATEFNVGFDPNNVEYVGSEAKSGYIIIKEVNKNGTDRYFTVLTLGEEKSGAVDLVKLTFRAINNNSGNIKVISGKLMINGQSAMWDIAKHMGSNYSNGSGQPTVTPVVTSVTGLQCGMRCGNVPGGAGCGAGMTCVPIWWPCATLPPQSLERYTNSELVKICPAYTNLLPKPYHPNEKVSPPSFYGVCRNAACVSSLNCICNRPPTGTPLPSIAFASANVLTGWNGFNYFVGGPMSNTVSIQSATGKLSSFDLAFSFDPSKLKLNNIVNEGSYKVLKKEIDNVKGRLIISGVINKSFAELPTNLVIGTLDFLALAEGQVQVTVDKTHVPSVVGTDMNGNSVNYGLSFNSNQSVVIQPAKPTPGVCTVCLSGITKKKGNANCDDKVDLLDFEYWRSEAFDKGGMTGKVTNTWAADFSCDGKVDLLDFEVWRAIVFP